MSNAKRCDRCGACYDIFPPEDCTLSSEWWRYDIVKDCHPYSEIRIDLCPSCRKNLYDWLKGGKQ